MSTLEKQLADAISAQNELTNAVATYKATLDKSVADQKAAYDAWREGVARSMPVSPNLLVDTKHFTRLCGGKLNTPTPLLAAHGAPWSGFLHDGAQGAGTIEIVPAASLAEKGIALGGDLLKAVTNTFAGVDFHAALFDVTISGAPASDGGNGNFFLLNQPFGTYTGWHRGEFVTQASCFVNVLSCDAGIEFRPHDNMSATVRAGSSLAGQGWTHLSAKRTGWGGAYQPRFRGIGKMRVAMALPYVGFGYHEGQFIWAGSVGRYSHADQVTY